MGWNVYELSNDGRTLLATVTGANARQVAKQFGRDYMAEYGGRVTIMKASMVQLVQIAGVIDAEIENRYQTKFS
jgi:hypothetical protein